jgi:hypothetical protein
MLDHVELDIPSCSNNLATMRIGLVLRCCSTLQRTLFGGGVELVEYSRALSNAARSVDVRLQELFKYSSGG